MVICISLLRIRMRILVKKIDPNQENTKFFKKNFARKNFNAPKIDLLSYYALYEVII